MATGGRVRRVAIVGGGIAGTAAALFLRRAGIEPVVVEARAAGDTERGAWLGLAPNGVNVLRLLGIDPARDAGGDRFRGIDFRNGAGRRVGGTNGDADETRFGAGAFATRRSGLHAALRGEAARQGIDLRFGRRVVGVEQDGATAAVRCSDGGALEADAVLACDGIHSAVRRAAFPDAPHPAYTGLINTGGFVRCADPPAPNPRLQMIFGRRAFFGYWARPDGEVWWFSNAPAPTAADRDAWLAVPPPDRLARLRELHRDDPDPAPSILAAVAGEVELWPSHDLPSLPRWRDRRVCLLGDAAHAATPHTGQGASLALEDAALVVMHLRDAPGVEAALAGFERARRPRVQRLVAQARRTGGAKVPTGRAALWLRDAMLPLFLRLGDRTAAEVASFRIDWDARAA